MEEATPAADTVARQKSTAEAARLLRLLVNEQRSLLLCHLVSAGEMTVSALTATVGLSQPALSQHLAMLRERGLVAPRKASRAARGCRG